MQSFLLLLINNSYIISLMDNFVLYYMNNINLNKITLKKFHEPETNTFVLKPLKI
jgi:hypothetical protein